MKTKAFFCLHLFAKVKCCKSPTGGYINLKGYVILSTSLLIFQFSNLTVETGEMTLDKMLARPTWGPEFQHPWKSWHGGLHLSFQYWTVEAGGSLGLANQPAWPKW